MEVDPAIARARSLDQAPPATEEKLRCDADTASDTEGPPSGKELPDERVQAVAHAAEKGGPDAKDAIEEEKVYISGLPLYVVSGSLALSIFLMLLDTSIISTAIPKITTEFQSLPDIGWYTASYQLASASLQPLTGKFYTHFKAKWTYLVFFFVFELGSLLCGLANSSSMLIGARAIAGMGASGLMNGGMTIVAGMVPLEKRPLYTGVLFGVSQLGIIAGPLVGGALTEYVTWRWCFYINLPIGGLTAALLIFCRTPDLTVKPPFTLALVRKTIPELDLVGFALFAPAAVMFLLALQWGGTKYPWNSSVVIGLFVGAGVTAVLFGLWENRMGDRAMLPGTVLKQRVVWCSGINGMSTMAVIFTAAQYMSVYFQGVRGEGPAMSGVDMLPTILSQLTAVVLSGALVQRVGYYMPFSIACSAISAIGNGLVSTYTPWTPTARWAGFQVLLGLGRGLGMQMGLIAVQNVLKPHQIPIGIAFLVFCQNISGAIFVVVGSVIFTQSLVSELAVNAPSVSPEAALDAGASASAVRALVPVGSPELDGVILSFSNAFDRVFYLLVACSFVGLISAFGMGWTSIKKKKTTKSAGEI